tara:strand:- start:399 stop:608 length:210 start_codon:yes stop_codon:yes gene_type:complete
MPGGRSSHASKRARRALNNGSQEGLGGGNAKMGLPRSVGVPIMLYSYHKRRANGKQDPDTQVVTIQGGN